MPGSDLASWGVAVTHSERTTASLERALRRGPVPVICHIEEDRIVLDMRTILPSQDEILANHLVVALRE